ncbi:hypothetical protein DQ06_04325 [Brachyspira hampsonii bv. II]|nr:hypothetical protein DQ06_04325 [Brachyspira hampsonii bv. II]
MKYKPYVKEELKKLVQETIFTCVISSLINHMNRLFRNTVLQVRLQKIVRHLGIKIKSYL